MRGAVGNGTPKTVQRAAYTAVHDSLVMGHCPWLRDQILKVAAKMQGLPLKSE